VASLSDLPLRDDLRGQIPYGAPQLVVPVALNVNENTHPIPLDVAADIVDRLATALSTANRYPDREFTALREDLAAYLGHGLSAENIWAGNGSNEVIQHLLQAFAGPGRSALGFTPTYSMYPLITAGTGARWIAVPRAEDYTVSAELAVAAIEEHRPDVVFFCSPNHPTGTAQSLEAIVAAYDATDGIVIVDEAYAEFEAIGTPSALTLLPGRERLVVLRTMSKAFAFAGVRLGYLAADPAVIDALRLVRLPYHLSVLTQAAARGALAHSTQMMAMVEDIKGQRDRIERELVTLGYAPRPSATNFVLFGGVEDPAVTFAALLSKGVLIRDVGIAHHLRVSAGTQAETTRFLEALADLGQPRQ
jgi:histidinol-phosphate aminotransferase